MPSLSLPTGCAKWFIHRRIRRVKLLFYNLSRSHPPENPDARYTPLLVTPAHLAILLLWRSWVHEPPFKTIEKIASALKLPLAYFFCEDDRLANIISSYQASNEQQKQSIVDFVSRLKVML